MERTVLLNAQDSPADDGHAVSYDGLPPHTPEGIVLRRPCLESSAVRPLLVLGILSVVVVIAFRLGASMGAEGNIRGGGAVRSGHVLQLIAGGAAGFDPAPTAPMPPDTDGMAGPGDVGGNWVGGRYAAMGSQSFSTATPSAEFRQTGDGRYPAPVRAAYGTGATGATVSDDYGGAATPEAVAEAFSGQTRYAAPSNAAYGADGDAYGASSTSPSAGTFVGPDTYAGPGAYNTGGATGTYGAGAAAGGYGAGGGAYGGGAYGGGTYGGGAYGGGAYGGGAYGGGAYGGAAYGDGTYGGGGAYGQRSTIIPGTSTTTELTTTTITTTGPVGDRPFLFCWSHMQIGSNEEVLIRFQLEKRASIFACNDFAVISTEKKSIGSINGSEVFTWFNPANVAGMGKYGVNGATTDSFLNTETFLQAWDTLLSSGKLWPFDFVVKADPDAVFFPDRLRNRAKEKNVVGQPVYFANCGKFGGHPMLYGSLEVFSIQALGAYQDRREECKRLPWHGWGEDYYMQHCMDMMGIRMVFDYDQVGDSRCIGAPCSAWQKVAFHDFKDPKAWENCFNTAIHR